MNRTVLTALATVMFGVTLWLFDIMQQPGTQLLASLACGVAANVTVVLIVAAARKDDFR